MKKHLSPSMIVSLLALLVALSGTAVAGSGLMSGTMIKAHSIAASRLTPTAIQYLKGQKGDIGPAGATGGAGAVGATGGFDPSKISYITGSSVTVAAGQVGYADATCPASTYVIGGGFYNSISSVGGALQPVDGSGTPVNNDWRVIVWNSTPIDVAIHATAICVAS